jgi:hypothetical protein
MTKLSLQERVRARLRDWSEGLTHAKIAEYFNVNRSSVTKLLSDRGTAITIDHLEGFAFLLQKSPSEMLAESTSAWQEVKPLEAQLLAHFRQMTELQRVSLLSVLDRSASVPQTRRRVRMGHAELTEEQQLVVDLYARSNEQARRGILSTLRGTAKHGDSERSHRTTE